MRNLNLTEHAQKRKQQRGITDLQIALIRTFGVDHYQKGGCSLSYIPEKKLIQLRNALDNLSQIALVNGVNEETVTVMHMDRRINKTAYAA